MALVLTFDGCERKPPPASGIPAAANVDLVVGTVELPAGFTHTRRKGDDSIVGHLSSADGKLVINYDIGPMAGVYAKDSEQTPAKINGLTALIVVKQQSAIVSFPDGGPTNFFAQVRGQDDIESVKKVAMSFKLKPGDSRK